MISVFRQLGLFVSEESEGRMYPVSFHSSSVLSALSNALRLSNVTLNLSTHVSAIEKDNDLFLVSADTGAVFSSRCVILTCGGSAQPKLGGAEDGYTLLQHLGHRIIPPAPALVPLLTDRKSISGLSGLRIRCTVSVINRQQILHSETGEVLFTEYGVSGICVMQCSRFAGSDTFLEMNFLPDSLADPSVFLPELKRRRTLFSVLPSSALLDGLFHSRIAYAILKQSGIPLRGESCADLSDADLERICLHSLHYRLEILGNRGFDYAQVTSGGADCSEFDPLTMESRIVSGLYAAGEVLNVDGDCGGFNLMFAFASGCLAGQAVSLKLNQGGTRF